MLNQKSLVNSSVSQFKHLDNGEMLEKSNVSELTVESGCMTSLLLQTKKKQEQEDFKNSLFYDIKVNPQDYIKLAIIINKDISLSLFCNNSLIYHIISQKQICKVKNIKNFYL